MDTAFRVVAGLTGALIAIESLALFIGMRLAASEPTAWACLKNYLFVLFDVLAGGYLIYVAIVGELVPGAAFFIVLILLVTLAHVYRGLEPLMVAPDQFLFNGPLQILNGFRVIGLVLTVILAFA